MYFTERRKCDLIIAFICMVVEDSELVTNRLYEGDHVYTGFLNVLDSTIC